MSPEARYNDGNRLGRILGRLDHPAPSCCHDDVSLEMHQLGHNLREPILLPLRISVLGGDVLSFYVAKLARARRIASDRADSVAASNADRYPIRQTFFGCCASAGRQSAKSMAQRARMAIFLFMSFSRSRSTCHSTLDTRPFLLDHFIRPREKVGRKC